MADPDRLPLIDGLAPLSLELQVGGKAAVEPEEAHGHGDTVYLLMKCHVADVRHPEIIDDGLRLGVKRREIVKADGAWVLPRTEGRALVALNMRRANARNGQLPLLPDSDLRDDVTDALARLADEADALFPTAPDDASTLT